MKSTSKLSEQYTRCPHCNTLYALFKKVDLNNVASVSCGTCHNKFVVKDHLTQPQNKVILPDKNNPYQARLSSVQETPPTKMEPHPRHVSAPTQPVKKAAKKIKWQWITACGGIFLAANLGMGSYMWLTGDTLSHSPVLRAWVLTLCDTFNCDITGYQSASKLQIQQHALEIDPLDPAKLQLNAVIQNTSIFPQPLSDLHLEIEDLAGNLIKTLTFTPAVYAPGENKPLESDQTISVQVHLDQSLPALFSYKVNF